MANNNISTPSTPPVPTFVPRIVMIATYTQQTQMSIIISTSSTVQTDTQTLHNTSTQTKTFQTTQATQTSPPQNSRAVQTDHMVNDISAIDSTDSSTSTDILDETVVSINQPNSNRKKKIHKDHSSDNRAPTKQRKRVSFLEDQQNSPKLLVNNISITEITPILETYGQQLETVQTSQTSFETLATHSWSINSPDTSQSLAQMISYHHEFKPMSSQQRAAMAQAALINFFGDFGTVSSIMQMVQPSQSQTLAEQPNQLTTDSEVMVSNNHQGMSLPNSTQHQNSYNNSPYTIPHITLKKNIHKY